MPWEAPTALPEGYRRSALALAPAPEQAPALARATVSARLHRPDGVPAPVLARGPVLARVEEMEKEKAPAGWFGTRSAPCGGSSGNCRRRRLRTPSWRRR